MATSSSTEQVHKQSSMPSKYVKKKKGPGCPSKGLARKAELKNKAYWAEVKARRQTTATNLSAIVKKEIKEEFPSSIPSARQICHVRRSEDHTPRSDPREVHPLRLRLLVLHVPRPRPDEDGGRLRPSPGADLHRSGNLRARRRQRVRGEDGRRGDARRVGDGANVRAARVPPRGTFRSGTLPSRPVTPSVGSSRGDPRIGRRSVACVASSPPGRN